MISQYLARPASFACHLTWLLALPRILRAPMGDRGGVNGTHPIRGTSSMREVAFTSCFW